MSGADVTSAAAPPLSPGPEVAHVSVVLPTIGRTALLRDCLASLEGCDPRADEIVVVDSSSDDSVARVVSAFEHIGARMVTCATRGLGFAFNDGIRAAKHEVVLLTNDDCVVEADWVGVGRDLLTGTPQSIVTGRVLPEGDPEAVPSTIVDETPREYAGEAGFFLFTQCMALNRGEVLEVGGFDGRITPSAEDNDLSYRWLRAGRTIRYEPTFVVWHREWRTSEDLQRLYVGYGIGQGIVYAKHLRSRDLGIARFVARDLHAIARGLVDRFLRGPRIQGDWRTGLARGLPIGLVRGWRLYGGGRKERRR